MNRTKQHIGRHVVVVGAGAAGHAAARALRQQGYTGRLTVVHGESRPPYNRTLVNKGVLPGVLSPEQTTLPPLEDADVVMVAARAAGVDADAGELALEGGDRLRYTALVAATGSRPRPLRPCAGSVPDRLVHMHTVEDAIRVRSLLHGHPDGTRVTLLGAGFIGSETASHLADLGVEVNLVSRPALPLAAAFGEAIGRRVADLHREHVMTHLGREVIGVRAGADSVEVVLDDDTRLESDITLIAHGAVPAARWLGAPSAGIRVDDRLRAPGLGRHVYAAGSVAVHSTTTRGRYRIDHWDAAAAQGAHAARVLAHDLLDGADPGPYAPTTGFTLRLYGQPLAAFGVPRPRAEQRQHPTGDGAGLLTTFHDPETGALTAVAGLAAGRELAALRGRLQRP